MAYLVRAKTLGDAWNESLHLFQKATSMHRYDSMRGPCVELEDVTISVGNITRQPRISPSFPSAFHPLIQDFSSMLVQQQVGHLSTLNTRLYHWEKRDHITLNQVAMVVERLREQPDSRAIIMGLWDPAIDGSSKQPSGTIAVYYRVRSGRLLSTVVIRTVDAWLGAVPALIGFADLQIRISEDVGIPVGGMQMFALSFHLYEMDLPMVLENLKGV